MLSIVVVVQLARFYWCWSSLLRMSARFLDRRSWFCHSGRATAQKAVRDEESFIFAMGMHGFGPSDDEVPTEVSVEKTSDTNFLR